MNNHARSTPRLALIGLCLFTVVVSVFAVRAPSLSRPVAYEPRQQDAGVHSGEQATLDDVMKIARRSLATMADTIQDYRGILTKRERIGGTLGEETKMEIKIRHPSADGQRGISVYLKFLEPASVAGREVIWVDGKNDGKLLSHEAGMKRLLGTMTLAPTGRLAMLGQKYPISDIGIMKLAEKLIEKGEAESALKKAAVTVANDALVGDRECQLVEVVNASKAESVDFHIAQIYIDSEWGIPLRYAAYMWPEAGENPPLEEEYTYSNIELNVGLTDNDFDPANEAYDFP